MKTLALLFASALSVVMSAAVPVSADVRDKVVVSTNTVGLHPGMDPGMYICGKGHLHIVGTVHNTSQVAVDKVKVGGKAYSADGRLLGEAAASPKQASLAPGEKAEVNLEFLTITGAQIETVKRHELRVIETPKR